MTLPDKYRADRLTDYYQVNLALMSPWQLRVLRVQVNGAPVSTGYIDAELERRRIADIGVDERMVECVLEMIEGGRK